MAGHNPIFCYLTFWQPAVFRCQANFSLVFFHLLTRQGEIPPLQDNGMHFTLYREEVFFLI
jgi:hypothetical protein